MRFSHSRESPTRTHGCDRGEHAVAALLTNGPREPGRPEPRAMLVDPPARPARLVLPELCAARGLYWGGEVPVQEAELSGTVLLNVLRD